MPNSLRGTSPSPRGLGLCAPACRWHWLRPQHPGSPGVWPHAGTSQRSTLTTVPVSAGPWRARSCSRVPSASPATATAPVPCCSTSAEGAAPAFLLSSCLRIRCTAGLRAWGVQLAGCCTPYAVPVPASALPQRQDFPLPAASTSLPRSARAAWWCSPGGRKMGRPRCTLLSASQEVWA